MKKLLKSTKGVFNQLGAMAVGIATLAITLVITFLVLSQGETQIIANEGLVSNANETSYALNATKTLASAVDDIPGWVPLIVSY